MADGCPRGRAPWGRLACRTPLTHMASGMRRSSATASVGPSNQRRAMCPVGGFQLDEEGAAASGKYEALLVRGTLLPPPWVLRGSRNEGSGEPSRGGDGLEDASRELPGAPLARPDEWGVADLSDEPGGRKQRLRSRSFAATRAKVPRGEKG